MTPALRTIQDELDEMFSVPLAAVRRRERCALNLLLRANRNQVVLFGAGSAGRRALGCLRSIGVEPLGFADNRPETWGTSVDGALVMRPEDAAQQYGSDALFIVTIWNAKHRFADTKRRLAGLGVRAIEPIGPVQWRFPESFLPFFSLDLPHRLYRERNEIVRAAALWADEQSRAEYLAHIRWRLFGDVEGVPGPVPEAQYFPRVFDLRPDEVFVDCGAYDGDTLREFLKQNGGAFRRFVSIEPSPDVYEALERCVATLEPEVRSRVALERIAVGDRCETVRFDAGAGAGGHLSESGTFDVHGSTLDRLCATTRATFIKMDIEGAEGAALAGARATILRDRPILAICAYHRPTDLWRLPLMVHDLIPSYRMYLRTHESDGWDAVAYAVPPERVRGELRERVA